MAMTEKQCSAQWTRLNKAVRAARQAAADFKSKPLSQEEVAQWRALVAAADAAQNRADAFYREHGKREGSGLLGV